MSETIKLIKYIKGVLFSPCFDFFNLLYGYLFFKIYNKTPNKSFQSLVNLFCLTRGFSNDILSTLVTFRNRPISFESMIGILGNMNIELRSQVGTSLRTQGFYVFQDKMNVDIINELVAFAQSRPATVRGIHDKKFIYDPLDLKGVRYDFDSDQLLELPCVQKLVSDHTFLMIAQDYLGAPPILDLISMWWHTPFQERPDEDAAQLFHFDMDRIKWIKFFIYLTDVYEGNGPHTFIPKTHRRFGIPKDILRKGYARISDKEASDALGENYQPKEFIGRQGTIIAEDTRGLHKGGVVREGGRLILQLQFTNHLFGANISKFRLKNPIQELILASTNYPRAYSNFVLGN